MQLFALILGLQLGALFTEANEDSEPYCDEIELDESRDLYLYLAIGFGLASMVTCFVFYMIYTRIIYNSTKSLNKKEKK